MGASGQKRTTSRDIKASVEACIHRQCTERAQALSILNLANELGFDQKSVAKALGEIPGLRIEARNNRRRWHFRGKTSQWSRTEDDADWRRCLCCDRPFASEGKHNRLCKTCRKRS